MLESISPYALLRASIPKPAPSIVTAYDLYSASQQPSPTAQRAEPSALPLEAPPAARTEPEKAAQPAPPAKAAPPVPQRKTHYIADIKTRHNAATRQAAMRSGPLA